MADASNPPDLRNSEVPRYFLHVIDDVHALDEEGAEYPDVWAARGAAIDGARELVCEQIRKGYLNLEGRIEIASDSGEVLMQIGFRDAFELKGTWSVKAFRESLR